MVKRALLGLRRVVDHPVMRFAVGAALITTAIAEADDAFFAPALSGDLGLHHGVFLLGVAHVLKVLPDLLEGIERVSGERPEA
jgi:hypothetical protein